MNHFDSYTESPATAYVLNLQCVSNVDSDPNFDYPFALSTNEEQSEFTP